MELTIKILQFVLSISILVVLHELGHFLPAKWFKTRVEKFYLFFDPYFAIVKKKIGETEYGIGWLPLGGYVKISGMIDESMDKEQMNKPAEPWEFRSKPAWQRLIIMLGGVTVNFILGFLLFGLILWHYGEEFIPAKNLTYGISVDSLGMKMGLQDGDKILKVGNATFDKFDDKLITREVLFNGAKTIELERNGAPLTINLDANILGELTKNGKAKNVIGVRMPFVLDSVRPGDPAAKAGLQRGDKLLTMDSKPISYYHQFTQLSPSYKDQKTAFTYIRGLDTLSTQITLTGEGKLGVFPYFFDKYFKLEKTNYSLAEAMPAGFEKGSDFLVGQFKAFGKMFSGQIKASESLGGFGSMVGMFAPTWDWEKFWNLTAMLSLILGFMNLLPIPALDGGYVIFLLWEMISGKKVSDKFMEKAVTVGFFLLIGLVIYSNGLDVFRAFKK
jgi:regulator of sigma E protease